jgi:pyruvate formate lyase activating enzyme
MKKFKGVTMDEKINEIYGRVHSMDTFSTVDGPGIRFVLFLQGCALKCKYCQNRDTWQTNIGELKTVDEIVEKICRYKSYMASSGGGVTVSGGEPLLQPKFLIELFSKLKELDINTCIDTSGMVPLTDDIKKVLSLTDLVLLDIKHIDPEKCKELVGFSNKLELEFAKYLSDNNIPVWIRQVLIPGITDDKSDLLKLRSFLDSLSNVKQIDVIPYHTLGKNKWIELGYKYELENIREATDEDVKKATKILVA